METKIITRAFVATKKMQPLSTASEHANNQTQFKDTAILRYNAQSSTSPKHIRCSVLGKFILRENVRASHLCSLKHKDSLLVLGKDISYVWDVKNCMLLYETIEHAFDAMDITFLLHPNTHQITLQVLYDDMLLKPVVNDFLSFEGFSAMSKKCKKTFKKEFQTFGDLNGKALTFPPLTQPSKTILQWASKSAYDFALKGSRSHMCAIASEPTSAEWEEMAKDVSPTASVSAQALAEEQDLASDDSEEGDGEG